MPGCGASCCGRHFLVGRHSPLAPQRGGLFFLLRRYYASHPAVTVAAPDPLAQNAIVNLGEAAGS